VKLSLGFDHAFSFKKGFEKEENEIKVFKQDLYLNSPRLVSAFPLEI